MDYEQIHERSLQASGYDPNSTHDHAVRNAERAGAFMAGWLLMEQAEARRTTAPTRSRPPWGQRIVQGLYAGAWVWFLYIVIGTILCMTVLPWIAHHWNTSGGPAPDDSILGPPPSP